MSDYISTLDYASPPEPQSSNEYWGRVLSRVALGLLILMILLLSLLFGL
jgi:hypothetical protein